MSASRFAPALASLLIWWPLAVGASDDTTTVLPRPPVPFTGTLEPTVEKSDQYRPVGTVTAPQGAPNVLLIMTDDVGFGAASTFGGPIPKPNLDRLARRGLIYNRFHTTGICSPTRAALQTGRNHHTVGTGSLVEMTSPYPGYTGIIPPSAATVARILRDNGYNTAMFGKDHNVPIAHRSPAGPFDLWPTGRGFEYFYGFIAGDSDQFQPALYLGTQPVDGSARDSNYIFDADMVDRIIEWVHNQKAAAPEKPFFIYQALGTAHAPHQVPAEWVERFRGRFDDGWDEERERTLARQKALHVVPANTELAPRPEAIPAWDSLTAVERKVYARFMEVYAAMLAHQDHQLGRLLDELERMGIADNTLVIYIEGDNGSAAEAGIHGSLNELYDINARESARHYDLAWLADHLDVLGGRDTYEAMPAGWSFAMSTPFPWLKQMSSHLGAVRNGLVVSWPRGITQRGLRSQYHHVIDVMPTILEAARIAPPRRVDGVEQQRIDGISMAYSFAAPDVPSRRHTQYYEVIGNRAIYHDGWLANTTPRNLPWNIARMGATDTSTYDWELYDLQTDFSQSRNLAGRYPERLSELKALFDAEARRNLVYPIQDSGAARRVMSRAAGYQSTPRSEYVFWGPNVRVPMSDSVPPMFWRPFQVRAEIEIAAAADGVLLAAGSHFGGWSFYLQQGRPVVMAALSPLPGGQERVAAGEALAAGRHTLVFDVAFAGAGANVRILADDRELARGVIAQRPGMMAGPGETLDTGRDSNLPVSHDYRDEGVFRGRLDKVTVKLAQGR